MAKDIYRDACAQIHMEFALQLQNNCWINGADCIVVKRAFLEVLFKVSRIKKIKLSWFENDVSYFFPYKTHTVFSKSGKLHSCYLSRFPFPEGVMQGRMTSEIRKQMLHEAGLKTIMWKHQSH